LSPREGYVGICPDNTLIVDDRIMITSNHPAVPAAGQAAVAPAAPGPAPAPTPAASALQGWRRAEERAAFWKVMVFGNVAALLCALAVGGWAVCRETRRNAEMADKGSQPAGRAKARRAVRGTATVQGGS
jgi:hypothetical protein